MGKPEKRVIAQDADSTSCGERLCRASLHARLTRVAQMLARRQQEALAVHALDLRTYAILARLEHSPCSTQLDLAKQSGVDKSTLVAILDLLEKEGWVERTPDVRDRRARIVCATASGKERLARAHRCVHAIEDAALCGLETDARAAFMAALAQLDEVENPGPDVA